MLEDNHYYYVIDARSDLNWVVAVEAHTLSERWDELWTLALSAPPIWTVRIVKYLTKMKWRPLDDQTALFDNLASLIWAFDENDLPGPDRNIPMEHVLDNLGDRITTARITSDGEFLFVVDSRGLALEVRKLPDLEEVARIRLDSFGGKIYAPVAFAITEYGDTAVALLYESKTNTTFIHVYRLEDGEVVNDKLLKIETPHLGTQITRLVISADSQTIFILTGKNQVAKFDLETGNKILEFENLDSSGETQFKRRPFTVDAESSITEWQKFGRFSMADIASRSLAVCDNEEFLACLRYDEIVVRKASQKYEAFLYLSSTSGSYALSKDGTYVVTQDKGSITLHNLQINLPVRLEIERKYRHEPSPDFGVDAESVYCMQIGTCDDPTARISLSSDRQTLAVAMPNYNKITLWRLPGGRCLGSLYGLRHDVISDFRITSSGAIINVTRSGRVQIWKENYYGNAWAWSPELIHITHHPVNTSSVELLGRAKEMRRRGWLSLQEENLLDIALLLFNSRLCLDVEIDWQTELPGDKFDIEID